MSRLTTVAFAACLLIHKPLAVADEAAEDLYPTWRQNVEQWKLIGGDFGYHYLGSAIWFNRMGRAMADAMLELLKS